MGSTTEIALVVGITMGLIEVIKKLVDQLGSKKNGKHGYGLSADEHEWLHDLHKMHSRYDEDGVPLWYVPRSWAQIQREIVAVLREITQDQKKIAEMLARLEKSSEKLRDKISI